MRPPNEHDRNVAFYSLLIQGDVGRDFSPNELDSRRKPGPKPKESERRFLYERVYDLVKSEGLSFREIAQRIWKDPSKRHLASVHYQKAIKLGFPPIKPSGK